MCGIVGELNDDTIGRDRFLAMRDALAHRGPDGSGLHRSDDGTVALGFRRLAIIDLTEAGNQPLVNEDGTAYLVFNGEIYNFRDLRQRLRDRGHSFTSDTDSEVILHGYEEWGTDVLSRLRGMFAFAIWDAAAERLFLARDRLGIKPLYYYDPGDRFVFASEPAGILADDRVPRKIDPAGLVHYFRYRYVPAPLSIWEDMYKVPEGHYLLFEGEDYSVHEYWQPPPPSAAATKPTEVEAVADLYERLRDAVRSHLLSDVPLGVLLSGGVDSSTITALAASERPDLTTFSMGFDPPERSELEHSRAVTEALGVDNTERVLSPDSLDRILPRVVETYSEPLADSSIFPTYLLMNEVSDELKVALSGDGGDELFAGYRWYDRYLRYRRFSALRPLLSPVRSLTEPIADRTDHSLIQVLDRELHRLTARGIDQYQLLMHPSVDDATLEELLGSEYRTAVDGPDEVASYARGDMGVRELQHLDLATFLPDDVLVKVDRASMANSVEVRPVFLDHPLVENVLSLDETLLYRDGEKKHLLKRLARELVPASTVDRPKSGFGAPLEEMGFLERYRGFLEDSHAARDGVFVDERLADLAEDARPPTQFKLILFELWYRHWVDGIPAEEVVNNR
jgi:asparagine synthase (glutamine-hydrolysing)